MLRPLDSAEIWRRRSDEPRHYEAPIHQLRRGGGLTYYSRTLILYILPRIWNRCPPPPPLIIPLRAFKKHCHQHIFKWQEMFVARKAIIKMMYLVKEKGFDILTLWTGWYNGNIWIENLMARENASCVKSSSKFMKAVHLRSWL